VVSAAYVEFMSYLEMLYQTDQDRLEQRIGLRAPELGEAQAEISRLIRNKLCELG
jgi:hypothetical protein